MSQMNLEWRALAPEELVAKVESGEIDLIWLPPAERWEIYRIVANHRDKKPPTIAIASEMASTGDEMEQRLGNGKGEPRHGVDLPELEESVEVRREDE